MENFIEYRRSTNTLREATLQLGHDIDVGDGGNYLLVPFSLRMLPLVVWGLANEYRVISEDYGETDEANEHAEREAALPGNVAIGRLDALRTGQLNTKRAHGEGEMLADTVRWYPSSELPLRTGEWTSHSRVDVLRAHYVIEDADGGSVELDLHPEIFLYEHTNGEFTVLCMERDGEASGRQESDREVSVGGDLVSAVDIFVRLQAGAQGFNLEGSDSDIWEDLRGTQVLVAAARARGDYKGAAILAARFFELPEWKLEKHLP